MDHDRRIFTGWESLSRRLTPDHGNAVSKWCSTVVDTVSGPPYPAARAVAPMIEAVLSSTCWPRPRLTMTRRFSRTPPPSKRSIDTAFWASLRREEGYEPEDLARIPSSQSNGVVAHVRAAAGALAGRARPPGAGGRAPGDPPGRLARGGRVAGLGDDPCHPEFCFVLEVVGPGVLVVKHRRRESGKFVNVLVHRRRPDQGGGRKRLQPAGLPYAAVLACSGSTRPAAPVEDVNVLVELAVSMRTHGRGGSLLVVPAGDPNRGDNRFCSRSCTRWLLRSRSSRS